MASSSVQAVDRRGIVTTLLTEKSATLVPLDGGNRLAIVDEERKSVWTTDGTPSNTTAAMALPRDDYYLEIEHGPVMVGGRLVVAASNDGPNALFFEGDSATTPRQLREICGDSCYGSFHPYPMDGTEAPFVVQNGMVFFLLGSTGDVELWRSDGTQAGTGMVVDACPKLRCGDVTAMSPWEDGVMFRAPNADGGTTLWFSDGTLGTATPIADGSHIASTEGPTTSSSLVASNPTRTGEWLFALADPIHGTELWTGRPGEAALVADLGTERGLETSIKNMEPLGNSLWFAACRSREQGILYEYWTSNGVSLTTEPYTKRSASCDHWPTTLHSVGLRDRVLFEEELGIVSTDGTAAGTSFIDGFFLMGSISRPTHRAFLNTRSANELWVSDGTLEGTERVSSLPGRTVSSGLVASRLYLILEEHDIYRLWISDGSTAGTRPVAVLGRADYLSGRQFMDSDDQVFFVVDREGSKELWVTEGTQATTRRLRQLGKSNSWGSGDLVPWGGRMFFMQSFSGGPQVLWASDGTPTGTYPYRAIEEGLRYRSPSVELAASRAGLVFTSFSMESGSELWVSDGTETGTRLLRDLFPGRVSSTPDEFLTVPDGRVFFSASTPAHGHELWVTNGTEAGTRLVHDLHPGASSSDPGQLIVAGDHLYFVADDGVAGRQLWALPLSGDGPACRADEASLCLQDDRFRVEMQWTDFEGQSGVGKAQPLTEDTGYFWFFDPDNVEAVIKVLDGRAINDHFWTYYGALSNVEYHLTVTDTQTGATRRYFNPPKVFASAGDSESFGPRGASPDRAAPFVEHRPELSYATTAAIRWVGPVGSCVAGEHRVCLNGGRFAVEVTWTDFQGGTGAGMAEPLTADTGYFWFFDEANVELTVKVLDATAFSGHYWVYYGSLSNVAFELTVTDTLTGRQRVYRNPPGRFASGGDSTAFPAD